MDTEESTSVMDNHETLISTTGVELLKSAWRNEKSAPEILLFEASLFQRIKEQIELASANDMDPLTVSLYRMDFGCNSILLRSYLRVRLQKIESSCVLLWCTNDLGKHFDDTVLAKLPDNYQSILKQSITSEEDAMVPVPRPDTFLIRKAEQYFEPGYSTEITEMERDLLRFACYKFIKKPLVNGFH
ncbi:hypothetical protein SADUNF_Sadunf10G0111900 [Salix dunnii]|uniref:DNA replication complex GINS protein SLD5 n=1 Tax=Salix dunnii TaxID=1413687 RepID=A0A835MYJ6_9ROSI|nr:hypothetical protein SADUNF_Sadunf10G0111900 [Salix dunnii]